MKKGIKKLLIITMVSVMCVMPQNSVFAATITVKGTTQTVDTIPTTPAEDVAKYESLDSYKAYQFDLASDTKEVVVPIKINSKGATYFLAYNNALESMVQSLNSALKDDSSDLRDLVGEDLSSDEDYYDDEDYDDEDYDESDYDNFNYDIIDMLDEYKALYSKAPQNNINFKLYKDAACSDSNLVSEDLGVPLYGFYLTSFKVPAAGTYYMKLSMKDYAGAEKLLYNLYTLSFSGEDRALKTNDQVMVSAIDNSPIYYKVTPAKDGLLTIDVTDATDYSMKEAKLTLCDANKKVISNTYDMKKKEDGVAFAVTKGDYYISLAATATKDTKPSLYTISTYYNNITKKSGSDRSSAKKIYLGKEVNGLQALNENKADWYQIKTSKQKKLKIELSNIMTSGNLKVTLYDKNNKAITCTTSKKSSQLTYTTKSKLAKGTYYIKIEKSTEATSGSYTLLVK
ncbi:pre-peptidase C-terminal domain-containing protein [Anaeromicropila herbilytica]|uniref:Peptidase C-terminal archaeal/bacterial domain-containing protein n=1 Tax=Anaeromicropila herbilytica TaxID=2785025 RepID=A0A7R7ENB9_9FIRM|nr:pre-peptidase C-terminal domain-containing protein [Anaeromicropila herbilytica]BCN32036.1 hypothetical protein bsdtb5_33310 [Anaeromicropila herbilytica]